MSVWAKLGIALCLLVLVYLALVYFMVRSTNTEVSDQEPFKSVVGKRVKTVIPMLVVKPNPAGKLKNDFALLAKNGPQEIPPQSIVAELPLNTEVFIQHAWLNTNGSSGSSTPFLSGEVLLESSGPKPVTIDYLWGWPESDIWNKPDVYRFKRAFWQTADPVPDEYVIKAK